MLVILMLMFLAAPSASAQELVWEMIGETHGGLSVGIPGSEGNYKGELVKILNLGREEKGFYLSKDKAAYWDGINNIGGGNLGNLRSDIMK